MALTQSQVSALYIALLGRASEGQGNIALQGSDLNAAAATILASQEGAARLAATPDNASFIAQVYSDLLGKGNGVDDEGKAYWVNELNASGNKAAIVARIIEGGFLNNEQAMTNKIAASDYFAQSVYNIGTAPSTAVVNQANNLTKGVTADKATLSVALNTVDTIRTEVGTAADYPATASLTPDIDKLTGSAGVNDVFTATYGGLDTDTLQVEDTIVGNTGNNTLAIKLSDSFDAGMNENAISQISKLQLTSNAGGAINFNANNLKGLNSIELISSDGINLSNVANIVDLGLKGYAEAAAIDIPAMYAADVVKNTTVQNIILQNVNHVDDEGNLANTTYNTGIIGTVNYDLLGATTGITNVGEAATINVTGRSDLNFTNDTATNSLKVFNAGTLLGNTVANLNSTNLKTVSLGAGDDLLNLQAFKNGLAVDGGTGTNQVAFVNALQGKVNLTNIQSVDFKATDNSANLLNAQSVKDVYVQAGADAAIKNGAYETLTFVGGNSTTNSTSNNTALKNLNFVGTSAQIDAGDAIAAGTNLTINQALNNLNVTLDEVSYLSNANLTANKLSNIAITSGGAEASNLTLTANKLATLTLNTNGKDFTLNGSGANSFTKGTIVGTDGEKFIATTAVSKSLGTSINATNAGLELGDITSSKNAIDIVGSGDMSIFKTGALNAKTTVNLVAGDAGTANLGNITAGGTATINLYNALDVTGLGNITAKTVNYTASTYNTTEAGTKVNLTAQKGAFEANLSSADANAASTYTINPVATTTSITIKGNTSADDVITLATSDPATAGKVASITSTALQGAGIAGAGRSY